MLKKTRSNTKLHKVILKSIRREDISLRELLDAGIQAERNKIKAWGKGFDAGFVTGVAGVAIGVVAVKTFTKVIGRDTDVEG